jgi:aryl-alcohol dehydrogenase-like predicted oxidoreductase
MPRRDMEKRRLGRLGHMSSVLIYGGAALAKVSEAKADESVQFALDSGINLFDTSDDYGDSELQLGRWMRRIRDRVFLATKTSERSARGAAGTIRRSLKRLNVDRVDLLQLHAICDLEELDEVTRAGGALEAIVAARDEGLVGGIGITGHGVESTATHLEALRRFPFDTILTPYSYRLWREARFRADFERLADEMRAQDVGLMLIKHVARNLWRNDESKRFTTWYEPLEEQDQIDAAVAFALAREEATGLCTASDIALVPRMVEAERKWKSISPEEIEAALSRLPAYESPFVSAPERPTPDWLREPAP